MARKGSGGKQSGRKPSARKQTKPEQTKPDETAAKAKDYWRGWAFIALLAVAIVVFVALGAMDADTRYDLIGV